MAETVLIVIANSERELFGCSLLTRYLDSMGIRSVICSMTAFHNYYARYVPDAVIWPNAFQDLSSIAESSLVFVLPSESANGQPDQMRATHGGTPTSPVYAEAVDRFFCWGPGMREILLETGTWREEQLVVTGSPATDHWLLPGSATRAVEQKIGLTTSFRVLSNSDPPSKMNYFQWIDEAEAQGWDGTYYRPPEHAESWLFFEASLARVIASLVRVLAEQRTERLEIRPHPGAQESRFEYFRTLSNGRVSVMKKGVISEWLDDVSILFTFISASALDAIVRGVPVVSLKGLIDQDALRKIPRDFHYTYDDMMWQLEDVSQAVSYVDLAMKGQLEPCRDKKRFYEFLAQYFLFPRKYPAAYCIASEIKKVLEGERSRKKYRQRARSLQGGRGVKQIVRRYVPMFPQLMALRQYIDSLRPGHKHRDFTYQPWRVWKRRAAMQTADRVLASIGQERAIP